MPKFTPGPWAVQDPMGRDIGFWIVQDGLPTYEWSCIATVHYDDAEARKDRRRRFISMAEQNANADLIAAAPDLYTILSELVEALDGRVHSTPLLSAIAKGRAALSRADGGTP